MSLRLESGARCALVGANGAGKTTMLSMLAGQLEPNGGHLSVGGIDVEADAIAVRARVAFVSDRLLCCPWLTARLHFNLQSRFFPDWDMELAVETAAALKLDLDEVLQSLSRGNSLKVALCSAFAQSPQVILLDEPTAGLDPVAREEFLRILAEQLAARSEMTVVYATHILEDLDALEPTDLIILKTGKGLRYEMPSDTAESASARARTLLLEGD
jgi:ABC-2 type transport system ATP-binding protein